MEGEGDEKKGSSDGDRSEAEGEEEEKPPEEEEKQEGEEPAEDKPPPKLVEARLEDKVLLVNPNMKENEDDEGRVYVLHQYAGRLFREDLAENVKKLAHGFEDVDMVEVNVKIEEIAEKVE